MPRPAENHCMKLDSIIDAIHTEIQPLLCEGTVANYIPALAEVDRDQFGMVLQQNDGVCAATGAADTKFSIQSISKVFSLTLAMQHFGEALWRRIGREPSGDPFNSLIQLEQENGIPRNPLINAGAICVADRLVSACDDPKRSLLSLVSDLCGETVNFDLQVAESEREKGYRNAALANFMKSFGNLDNPVDEVLDVYFHQCSISLSCRQLARALGYLANDGLSPSTGQRVVTDRQARRVNALMLTCGTYDEAGEFAFRVGLPCKSGVGGGIVATVPNHMTLCVWSPGLGVSGNSLAGFRALELFTDRVDVSVF